MFSKHVVSATHPSLRSSSKKIANIVGQLKTLVP